MEWNGMKEKRTSVTMSVAMSDDRCDERNEEAYSVARAIASIGHGNVEVSVCFS